MKPDRCDSTWIQTFTGRQFWPLNPRAEDVCIEDIAHALSMKCRYTGHCRQFYSVAQHSVIMTELSLSPHWALMHDAAEAYMPDVARPVKRLIPQLKDVEDGLLKVIAEAFSLEWPIPKYVEDDVKSLDLILLSTFTGKDDDYRHHQTVRLPPVS